MTNKARDTLLIGAALACALVVLVQLLDYGYGRDQGVYATVGRTLASGGAPYRDAWDVKPPGVFFVYAFAQQLFGAREQAIRWLEVIGLVSLIGAFALISWNYWNDARPGLLGAAFAIVAYVQLEFWNTAQPESFGAILVAWGLACATVALEAGGRPSPMEATAWFGCGLCTGLAAVLKPSIAFGGCASAGLGVITSRSDDGRWSFRKAAAVAALFASGVAIPIALCLIFFSAHGGLGDLIETLVVYAPEHVRLAWERRTLFSLVKELLHDTFAFSVIGGAGALLLVLPLPSPQSRRGLLHLALVLGALQAGVLAQARIFAYHMTPVLIVVSVAAGWGFWRLWMATRERTSGALMCGILLVTLGLWQSWTLGSEGSYVERSWLRGWAWAHPVDRQGIRDQLYSGGLDYQAYDNRRVADWIKEHTSPEATIFVYGFTPEIYFVSGRGLASRYTYNVPLRAAWSQNSARAQLMLELTRSRPELVVIESHDFVDNVTGITVDSRQDSYRFAAFRTFVDSQYALVARLGRFDLYRRHG